MTWGFRIYTGRAAAIEEMSGMKNKEPNQSLTNHKVIGSGCGIFVAIFFAVPLVLIYYLFFSVSGVDDLRTKVVVLLAVCTLVFGSGIFLGIRDAVCRWREISKIQEILGAMTDDERKEFDDAIAQADVELCADETGKPHSIPLDH